MKVDWSAARDAVGLEVAVLVEETGQVLRDYARDVVRSEGSGITEDSLKHARARPRDGLGGEAGVG